MGLTRLINIIICILLFCNCYAQQDTAVAKLQKSPFNNLEAIKNNSLKISSKTDSAINLLADIPSAYFKKVDKKIDKYSNRITSKTEKTLTKLARWENKIKKLLDKASPETSAKLFGKDQLTFSKLLQQVKQTGGILSKTTAQYDAYTDKLSTTIKYIETQKGKLDTGYKTYVTNSSQKLTSLDNKVAGSDEIQLFIQQRKKQLLAESIRYIGKSKYLTKINKESYYYVETLRNYKEIFSDQKKAEQTAVKILNKIPAYQKFLKQNSALASLFGNGSADVATQNLDGLQTRSSISNLIQEKISTGGPNVKEMMTQQMQAAQGQLNTLKDKLSKYGEGSADMPDFKPNKQKTKTFAQRLQYGSNFQFGKGKSFMPATTDLGLSIGYKINDKSIVGLGAAYKLGIGTIQNIKLTHEGLGFRSFADWQLKKQFFISGGYEMNYTTSFRNLSVLNNYGNWQQSALFGITKKIKMKTKLLKGSSIQLMYDFLYNQHTPVGQPFIFRTGYTF